ncbi:MAG: DUF2577 domain-containing protein [Alphaproteobacteria bacterium]|nr:DUF2577 domain-containing protein [Alphaproteobacteria bacterium]
MSSGGKSIREMLKAAVDVRTASVLHGVVVSASPVKIQVTSDAKLLLTESNLFIPEHLTDHQVKISVSGGSGSTSSNDGHSHSVSGVSFSNATMTIKNALQANDEVYLLSFNRGQLYYVLDRVG